MPGEDGKADATTTQADEYARTSHDYELAEWARTMRVSPIRLRQAVCAVGITPRKIRAYLRQHP